MAFDSFCYFFLPLTPPTPLFPLYSPSFLHGLSLWHTDLDIYPVVGFLDHVILLYLIFFRNLHVFMMVVLNCGFYLQFYDDSDVEHYFIFWLFVHHFFFCFWIWGLKFWATSPTFYILYRGRDSSYLRPWEVAEAGFEFAILLPHSPEPLGLQACDTVPRLYVCLLSRNVY